MRDSWGLGLGPRDFAVDGVQHVELFVVFVSFVADDPIRLASTGVDALAASVTEGRDFRVGDRLFVVWFEKRWDV